MEHTEERSRRRPAKCPECEHASSTRARVQLAKTSPRQLAQTRRPQLHAICALAPRRTIAETVRRQCRCGHFLLPQSPTMGSRQTLEQHARLGGDNARDRATRKLSRVRK